MCFLTTWHHYLSLNLQIWRLITHISSPNCHLQSAIFGVLSISGGAAWLRGAYLDSSRRSESTDGTIIVPKLENAGVAGSAEVCHCGCQYYLPVALTVDQWDRAVWRHLETRHPGTVASARLGQVRLALATQLCRTLPLAPVIRATMSAARL